MAKEVPEIPQKFVNNTFFFGFKKLKICWDKIENEKNSLVYFFFLYFAHN